MNNANSDGQRDVSNDHHRSEVKPTLRFYLDDSGTRYPDHKTNVPAHGYDWFALGGILVKEEDEAEARRCHTDFCELWKINAPLHSHEIRSRRRAFAWIGTLEQAEQDRFYKSLSELAMNVPVVGLACVVDRPGYKKRYLEKYGANCWPLCRTAFSIAVERATKYAREIDRTIQILPERCNKKEDTLLKAYYMDMKKNGMPFSADGMEKYGPLSTQEFNQRLTRFETKAKTSPMAQLADLYLWPICMGGYDRDNMPYRLLIENGKLIECHLNSEAVASLGTKYSCFENAGSDAVRPSGTPEASS